LKWDSTGLNSEAGQTRVATSLKEELPEMERTAQEEIKAHLMATNDEFRKLADQHADYSKRVDALEAMPRPSEQEQIEEVRLKKLKLRLKDQMEAMILRYQRAQNVA
jgi:uncharacterized protein YdcH (DUF465 family)